MLNASQMSLFKMDPCSSNAHEFFLSYYKQTCIPCFNQFQHILVILFNLPTKMAITTLLFLGAGKGF